MSAADWSDHAVRWDPHRTDTLFLSQSAVLYSHYYFLQICIHRPFIPSSRKASRLPFPSLAICTNAARSCTHVIDIQYQRTGVPLLLNRVSPSSPYRKLPFADT